MEEWKDIPKYEGLYQISNFGRVKRLIGIEKILKPSILPRGRAKIKLYKNKKCKIFDIGRLVIGLFLGNKLGKFKIKNKDGDNFNNKVDNLLINPISKKKYKEPVIKKGVYGIDPLGHKYISIYWNKKSKLWKAQIFRPFQTTVNGVFYENGTISPIGEYPTKKEAISEFDKWNERLYNKH